MTTADQFLQQSAFRQVFIDMMKGDTAVIPRINSSRIQDHGIGSCFTSFRRNLPGDHPARILYLKIILNYP